MKVIKRTGKEVDFDKQKIIVAVEKANNEALEKDRLLPSQIEAIADLVEQHAENLDNAMHIEEIQNEVIYNINRQGNYEVARLYTEYRYKRQLARQKNTTDDTILSLVEYENEEVKQENSNKNPMIASTQRDYIAGETSKDLTIRYLLPSDVVEAHNRGEIHFHDADYFLQRIFNCCLINLEDMLQNGTVINDVKINTPHSIQTAANVATQIIALVASSQYGGQTFNLSHLAPFVDVSRQKHRRTVKDELERQNIPATQEQIDNIAEQRVKHDIQSAVQTIQYQIVTIMTTNGQTPFVSLYMNIDDAPDERTQKDLAMLIEEVLRQRIEGLPNASGVPVTPTFPKILYVTTESNIHENSKFYYLTKLAAKCSAKRMVPDYISSKIMQEYKGDVYGCMGCRSFLTPDTFSETKGNIAKAKNFDKSKHHYWGRFNQGVVTVNLPYVALKAERNEEKFWQEFEKTLEICHKALRCRHERLKGTPSDIAPIHFQYGAIARLEKGETIDKLLYNNYSTISLGYAGLYECCMAIRGKSHTDPQAKDFALAVMQKLNDKCEEWKQEENIGYSVYGSPIESTTYKFAKALKRDFGTIKDVSDHNYITNSYHVCVREKIDAFKKLEFESEFQRLSPGGAISYIEVPNMMKNLDAVEEVIKFIHEHIMYAEINTKSDYCEVCGSEQEIKIIEENGKLIWECPICGNRDQSKMQVCRRTCGYLGSQFWNQGRTSEIKDRVMHL